MKQLEERKLGGVGVVGNGSGNGRGNNSINGQLNPQNASTNRHGANSNSTSGNNNNLNNMRRNQQQQNQGQKNTPSNMNLNNVVDISDDSPTERQPSTTMGNKIQIMTGNNSNGHHHQQQHLSNNTSNLSSDPYDVPNLSLRQVCLCGKSCQMMQPKKDLVFKCCHCHLYYHI